jgi:gamma-glutamylputrescine oxidase
LRRLRRSRTIEHAEREETLPATTPYWLAEAYEPMPRRLPFGRADVVVVGGGVTGCSCALSLAQKGVRVRLREAREIAAGASGRNGGFALRGGAEEYHRAREIMGAERARVLWELSERSLARLEALAVDAFRRVGSLRLAADAGERERLARERAALLEDGFPVEWVELLPAPLAGLYDGALLNPGDGAVHPVRWVRRLAAMAAAAGAEIVEGAPVTREELGALGAEAVVLATDGLSAELVPALAGVLWPVRGQMLVTQPLPERLYERPHYARGGFDYWQQLPEGRLAVGGRRDVGAATENTEVEETTPAIQEELASLAAQLAGRPVSITHRWAGIWGETPDRLPIVGRVAGRKGLWIAAGYSGHGNVLGLACGDLVARAVLGEHPPELELFEPERLLGPRQS